MSRQMGRKTSREDEVGGETSQQPGKADRDERGAPAYRPSIGGVNRRSVLRAAGAVAAGGLGATALAACGATTATTTEAAPRSGGTSSSGSGSAGGVSVKTADIPVGGGKAFPDASPPYVVTQPTAGTFKAFDGTCTHQGCPVTQVRNGHILCPCHGSMFDLSTGAPTSASPAKKPLTPKTATVSGDSVVIS
jgi:Rieske Fe-S protein